MVFMGVCVIFTNLSTMHIGAIAKMKQNSKTRGEIEGEFLM